MILYLTNAPSEILALRSIIEALPPGFPAVRAASPAALDGPPSLDGVQVVLVRLLGGSSAWAGPFTELRRRCAAEGIPLLAFGGEAAPDAELTAASTVPSATVAQAFDYLVHGGLANMEHLLRFVADTVCMTGFGFDLPAPVPATGVYHRTPDSARTATGIRSGTRPHVAVLFYRAHLIAGNTGFVDDLCAALEDRGARVTAVWCYTLRPDAGNRAEALDLLAPLEPDAVVTTVLVSGSASGDGLDWDASALGALGVPVVQAITATTSEAEWEAAPGGLSPLDVAMRVAIPEFDGRVVAVPFSFNEEVDDGDSLGTPVSAYRTVPDRLARVAGITTRIAALSRTPPAERRVALVLSAYPTRRGRIGNAVALDTPASVIALLRAMRDAGYRIDRIPDDGDALMAELIDTFAYERDSLTAEQLARAPGRWSADAYLRWWAGVDPAVRAEVERAWGQAPGSVYRDPATGDLAFAGLDLGGVMIAVQPPRGFGEQAAAIYHSPDLPPTHHYLGFYRWLDEEWGADAIVHAGKHGTLEWLPGKGVGLSARCFPDVALGDVPLVYPFVVNDPGEGTQAKRRAHATIVDHLLPPMTRADTYDDIARLEQLLDEHAQVASLDPSKLPAVRGKVWDLLVSAELHQDLGVVRAPDGAAFDELVNHIDGYLCELKDAQIRGGLHVLGEIPAGEARLDLPGRADPACPTGPCRPCASWWPTRLAGRRCASGGRRRSRRGMPGSAGRRQRGRVGGRGGGARLGANGPRAGARPDPGRDRPGAGRARRAVGAPRAERRPDAGHGPRPAERPQLLLGRPQGAPVPPGVGSRPGAGRRAAGPLCGGGRSVSGERRPRRVGDRGHAHRGRRRGRGPGSARGAAGLAGGIRARHGGGADPRRGARPTPGRRGAAHLRVLPGRVPPSGGPARRRRRAGRFRGRRPPHLRGQARGLRVGDPAPPREPGLANRRRSRRRVPGLERIQLRPRRHGRPRGRRHAPEVRDHRGRGQEPGQPRARHLRLGRLPAGPRRDGRDHSGPSGRGAQGGVR